MQQELEKAILLRKENKYKDSNQLLVKLVNEFPEEAFVNYQCAWSFDVLGREAEAAPYYEKAISLGLEESDLEDALIGLGSTYRTLGEYEKSQRTFRKAIELYPNNQAIQVFYAMTLYNLKEHAKAMKILLTCIAETSKESNIISFKRAIAFYSNKLDTTWG